MNVFLKIAAASGGTGANQNGNFMDFLSKNKKPLALGAAGVAGLGLGAGMLGANHVLDNSGVDFLADNSKKIVGLGTAGALAGGAAYAGKKTYDYIKRDAESRDWTNADNWR